MLAASVPIGAQAISILSPALISTGESTSLPGRGRAIAAPSATMSPGASTVRDQALVALAMLCAKSATAKRCFTAPLSESVISVVGSSSAGLASQIDGPSGERPWQFFAKRLLLVFH